MDRSPPSREDIFRRRGRNDEQGPKYRRGALWSPSYFAASCGGAPIAVMRQYIEQQRTPH